MKSNYKRLRDYIREVNVRNKEGKAKNLLGININKFFMPSVANVVGTDLTNYKLVQKNQFACNRMHVGRDYRIPISLSNKEEPFMVSPAYDVFEIKDPEVLIPEYLMMWFSRPEFDRNAWFYTDADVRGGLPWKAFLDLKLPIPHPDKQREIVAEYHTIQKRIELNNQLIQKLEETAQAIYKHWFVYFEFPDKNGMPYKSSGGEMVHCAELETEIPNGWKYSDLSCFSVIKAGGDKPKEFSPLKTEKYSVPVYSNSSDNYGLYGYTESAVINKPSITISARGAIIGFTILRSVPFVPIVRLIVVTPKDNNHLNYLYRTVKRIKYDGSGSAQGQLTVPDISSHKIIFPDSNTLSEFQKVDQSLTEQIEITNKENQKLMELNDLLLSKLATVNDQAFIEQMASYEY